jgi:hypothetical protein
VFLALQTLVYTTSVLELGGSGACLVQAAWPALRLLAPELRDPVFAGPTMQSITTFEDMTLVSMLSY